MFLRYEKSFKESVEKQIVSYHELLRELQDLKDFRVVQFNKMAFNYDFFDALNKERLFMALNKKKIDLYAFFQLHSFFRKVEGEMSNIYLDAMDKFRGLSDKWNSGLIVMHDFISTVNASNTTFTEDEKKELLRIYNNKEINQKSNLTEFNEKMVQPFFNFLIKKYNSIKGVDPELYKIIKDLQIINGVYSEFIFFKNDYINIIKLNIEILNSVSVSNNDTTK